MIPDDPVSLLRNFLNEYTVSYRENGSRVFLYLKTDTLKKFFTEDDVGRIDTILLNIWTEHNEEKKYTKDNTKDNTSTYEALLDDLISLVRSQKNFIAATGNNIKMVKNLNTLADKEIPQLLNGLKHEHGSWRTGGSTLECRTVVELKASARKRGISLKGITRKADIIAKLRRK